MGSIRVDATFIFYLTELLFFILQKHPQFDTKGKGQPGAISCSCIGIVESSGIIIKIIIRIAVFLIIKSILNHQS